MVNLETSLLKVVVHQVAFVFHTCTKCNVYVFNLQELVCTVRN